MTSPLTRRFEAMAKAVDHKEADVEETIGYEALFSPEEWASLDLVEEEPAR